MGITMNPTANTETENIPPNNVQSQPAIAEEVLVQKNCVIALHVNQVLGKEVSAKQVADAEAELHRVSGLT